MREASVQAIGHFLNWAIANQQQRVATEAWSALVDCSRDASPAVRRFFEEIRSSLPGQPDLAPPQAIETTAAAPSTLHVGGELARERKSHGWTAHQISDEVVLEGLRAVSDRWTEYENPQKRDAALERFHEYAYQWY